jgi:hypothetical protein
MPGKQTEVLMRSEDEILFHGSRGFGKTETGLGWLIEPKYINNPLYRALVIRKKYVELRDWVDRAIRLYRNLGAKPKGDPAYIQFPSGATIYTGHLNDESSADAYQGHEYHKILFEELTKISSERAYAKIIQSCRSTVPGLKPQVLGTTNPDGPGHFWVKNRFIVNSESEEPFKTKAGRTRIHIHALVDDNEVLMKENPEYLESLEELKNTDPELYKQWRWGDWTSFDLQGSYYGQLIQRAREEGRVFEFPIQQSIPVNTLWDLGISEKDKMSVWFYQVVNEQIRFIYYFEDDKKGYNYYYNELMKIAQNFNFVYGIHYFPHDIKKHEHTIGITRLDYMKDLFGEHKCQTNAPYGYKAPGVQEGIGIVKDIIAHSWFHAKNCKHGLELLSLYREKYNEELQRFTGKPVHDYTSHCADALRTGCTILIPRDIMYQNGTNTWQRKESDTISPEEYAMYCNWTYYRNNPAELKKLRRLIDPNKESSHHAPHKPKFRKR